jgi:hypothetical protein
MLPTASLITRETVPRIAANRNRAVFQLSSDPEFYGFFVHVRAAKNIFCCGYA